jgi:hypothetical protein
VGGGDVLPAGGPVQFVVDTAGLADMRSLKVLRAADAQFARAVADVIPQCQLYPGQLGSCKVQMYVQMPFSFRMQGYPDVPFGPVDRGYVPSLFPPSPDARTPLTP